ncbi:hypothetical protein ACFXPA_45245 [Amycolatopsis sp. NPDC059090]|uniref:hypothetical protein n=1 Tax=Amycolatopsis sp. NPDC059090 TaxID=3346723 RepID=UPI00366B810F
MVRDLAAEAHRPLLGDAPAPQPLPRIEQVEVDGVSVLRRAAQPGVELDVVSRPLHGSAVDGGDHASFEQEDLHAAPRGPAFDVEAISTFQKMETVSTCHARECMTADNPLRGERAACRPGLAARRRRT